MYTLGETTLPTPKPGNFQRKIIEMATRFTTLDGTDKKDITNRKEQFILYYEHLTQSEVTNILSEYNDLEVKNFSVSDTNLTINSTPVHVEVTDRQYNTGGNEYREDLTLILTEVV